MPNSLRYKSLTRRLDKIRDHFLPATFPPTGRYSQKEQDLARAYRILAHAEIEDFIEMRVWGVAQTKLAKWKSDRKPSDVLTCLLCCYHSGWDTTDSASFVEAKKHVKLTNSSTEDVLDFIVTVFYNIINTNHGVKEDNLRKLLIPIGIRISDINPPWLVDMTNYGGLRGHAAHHSGVRISINPQDELNIVNNVLVGLSDLDELIGKL